MKKEQIIRPVDAKEYIGYQFQGLAETLEQFDYGDMAKVVRATQAVFNTVKPETHKALDPDCILLTQAKVKG